MDGNGDTAMHVCAVNNSANALITIVNWFLKGKEEEDDEGENGEGEVVEGEEKEKKLEVLKRALNI